MKDRYWSTDKIMDQILLYEKMNNLSGYIILVHIGTDDRREDKLYNKLDELIEKIQSKNYKFVPLNKL